MRNAKSMPLRLSCFPRVSKADAKTLSSDEETMSLGGGGGGNVTPTQPTPPPYGTWKTVPSTRRWYLNVLLVAVWGDPLQLLPPSQLSKRQV